MAQDVSLTQYFTYTVNGVTYTGGSTTTPEAITIDSTEVFDKTYKISASTTTEILSCGANPETGDNLANFDFLWIQSDTAGEIQLVCNENGTVSNDDMELGFVLKLAAGIPFILPNDDSRNAHDVDTAGAADIPQGRWTEEMDDWENDWVADQIDRIEWYHTSGVAKVRVVAFT